jgi:queuine tRNA-ribosyltransferase
MSIPFKLIAKSGKARRGMVSTAHGEIQTPAFMPVGTQATVKAMRVEDVAATGSEILLCNTYHLMLRPTPEVIEKLGGLHKFMNWNGPLLTDSGGFQVMSLRNLRKITEEGARFKSPIDGGKTHMLSPELSIEIQRQLDSDITMVLDECLAWPVEKKKAERSMRMTTRWAERSRGAFVERPGYGIFGIVQGSMYRELREESARDLTKIGFDGYAVGGLAIGEPQETMFEVLDYTCDRLPEDRPRYLMGVVKPSDIIGAVARGIDMFDCVLPCRSGRTGQAFVHGGVLNIRNSRHREDSESLDPLCQCPTCRNYSRAYLHHLCMEREILGAMLLTQHNIWHYQDIMRGIRGAIEEDRFDEFATKFEG